MIFSSIQYLLFLPVVVFLYWRMTGFARLCLVVAASYFFYMSWLPIYGLLLLILSTVNWILGLAIERLRENKPLLSKGLLTGGIGANLLCLCYYKYTNFIIANILAALGIASSALHLPLSPVDFAWSPLDIILPLGISFFVFEFIHYLVDVYRGSKALGSWFEFAAFAAFFPSQIAGPIKRYQEFVEWLRKPLPWKKDLFFEGMTLIIQGMFKKVAIADPIGAIIAPSYATLAPLSGADAFVAAVGFSLQIFCDFSGYTDIGRGSALLLGIRLPENFQLPYLAQDLTSFWRRWHMSLSFWIRDYVYIPMGGSKDGRLKNMWNLFATMSICGLWHGAAWQFIAWGSCHGLGLIVNREFRVFTEARPQLARVFTYLPVRALCVALTFSFVCAAFVMFRAPDLAHTANIFSSLLNFTMPCQSWVDIESSGILVFMMIYLGYWLIGDLGKDILGNTNPHRLIFPAPVRLASWTAAILLMIAAKPTQATPFIYFQF